LAFAASERERCEQKNCQLIAHRLATVQSADQIIVIKDGTLVESGPPHVLSQQNGLYADLYRTKSSAWKLTSKQSARLF
jgi:ABC-type multidrug transport system fused ATPase/permease subunit